MGRRQEDLLATVSEQLSTLSLQLTQLLRAPSSVPDVLVHALVPTTVPTPTQLARPEKFSGDSGDCHPFLVQCEMHKVAVMDYVIEFRTLATDCGWNNTALVDAFVGGLTHRVKEQFTLELLEDLDDVIDMINKIDRWLSDHLKQKTDTLLSS